MLYAHCIKSADTNLIRTWYLIASPFPGFRGVGRRVRSSPRAVLIWNGVCQKIRHTDFDHREPGASRALCAQYFLPAGSSRQSLHVHAIGCSSTLPATRRPVLGGKDRPRADPAREGIHRAASTFRSSLPPRNKFMCDKAPARVKQCKYQQTVAMRQYRARC